ncbi:shikimate kinase [Candidatus Pelagibacter bacterium]|nr:shikimate kinase [Candidatus Pelagibacter bacterium]
MKKNVVLTGMMGVGKSTIGKNLAKKLFCTHKDIDRIIEEKEGCTINNIFKNKGENYFRMLEYKTTLTELKKDSSVISLGGGAFLNKEIRKAVKKSSISFWLDINLGILINRLKKSKKRPLLFRKNISDTIGKIYFERKKTYSEADYRLKCDKLKTDTIVGKILEKYENT